MANEVFWGSTPHEVEVLHGRLLKERKRQEKDAIRRAGLIAATILNVHRKRGTSAFTADDFVKKEPQVLTPEQMLRAMRGWSKSTNRMLDS